MTKLLLSVSLLFSVALTATADTAALYKSKCASCHGKHGERKAMNTSRVIASLSKAEIETALNGYKDGSYGGKMKKVKMGIVKGLDSEQISELAGYVSTLSSQE